MAKFIFIPELIAGKFIFARRVLKELNKRGGNWHAIKDPVKHETF